MQQDLSAIRQLMLANMKMEGGYYFFSRKLGIKQNIMTLLYALADGKEHTQKQICQDWLIPKTTLNTNVKELVDAGYANLSPGKNTREKIVALTHQGKIYAQKMVKNIYQAEQAAMNRALEKYSIAFVDAMDYFADCLCDEFEKQCSQ